MLHVTLGVLATVVELKFSAKISLDVKIWVQFLVYTDNLTDGCGYFKVLTRARAKFGRAGATKAVPARSMTNST